MVIFLEHKTTKILLTSLSKDALQQLFAFPGRRNGGVKQLAVRH